jgi:hypothetical protein
VHAGRLSAVTDTSSAELVEDLGRLTPEATELVAVQQRGAPPLR